MKNKTIITIIMVSLIILFSNCEKNMPVSIAEHQIDAIASATSTPWPTKIPGNTNIICDVLNYYSLGFFGESAKTYLLFQSDGNLVLYIKDQINGQLIPQAHSNTWNTVPKANLCLFQPDGNLVLYYYNGSTYTPVWHTGTFDHQDSKLHIWDGGTLKLYNNDGQVLHELVADGLIIGDLAPGVTRQ